MNKFNLGEIIFVVDGGFGCRIANGTIGVVVKHPKKEKENYHGSLVGHPEMECVKDVIDGSEYGLCEGRIARVASNAEVIKYKHDRLKELLTIKRDAQAILDDDTVNSWMTDKDATRKYTEAQVKQAADDYNNAVKETDLIIENL